MATNDYRLRLIADISQLLTPLQSLPGATQKAAQQAALRLSQALQQTGGTASAASAAIQAYRASLVSAGLSEKDATRETLRYAGSLNAARDAAQADAAAQRAAAQATQAKSIADEQASQRLRNLQNNLRGANGAAGQLGSTISGNLNAGVVNFGQQVADVGVQLQMGTNPFTILVQQGPQVLAVIAQTTGGLRAIGGAIVSALAPAAPVVLGVAAAVGTLYLAYKTLNEENERTKAITGELNQLFDASAAMREDAVRTVRELGIATGYLTEEQGKFQEAQDKAWKDYLAATDQVRTRLAEIRREQGSVATWYADLGESMEAWSPVARLMDGVLTSTSELRAEEDILQSSLLDTVEILDQNVDRHKELIAQQKKNKDATDNLKKSKKDLKDALKELNDAMAAEIALSQRNSQTYYGAIQSLTDLRLAAERADDVERQRIETAYDAAVAQAQTARDAAMVAQDSVSARENIEREYADTVLALNTELYRQLRALEDEFTRKKQQQADKRAEQVRQAVEKEQALYDKGQKDRKAMIDEDRQMALDFAKGYLGAVDTLVSATSDRIQAALDATRDTLSSVQDSLGAVRDWLSELSNQSVDASTLTGKALVDAYKSGEVAAEDLTDAQKAQLASQLAVEEARLAAQEKSLKQQEQAQKDAALEAWRVQQASSIASAVVLTAQTILQALASAPYPYNLAIAATAGIAAGAEVAAIASAQPPAFRAGYFGSNASASTRWPDQQLAYIEPATEVVMPSGGVQAAGGKEKARQQAAGIPPVVQSTAILKIGHKAVSAMVVENRNKPGPLRDLSVRPSGRTNPYKLGVTRG